jgi:hypothetical protein
MTRSQPVTAPSGQNVPLDQSLDVDDLRRAVQERLGAAAWREIMAELLLAKREQEVLFLRDQLAARDAADAPAAEHATADR